MAYKAKDPQPVKLHVCWFDGKDYDDIICHQRRATARFYLKKKKELPMPQCLKCTPDKWKPYRREK